MEHVASDVLLMLQSQPEPARLLIDEFETLTTNADRVLFVLDFLKSLDKHPDEPPMRFQKNNKTAREKRKKGNKFFENKKPRKNSQLHLFNALELYNESICWAELNKGEDLAIAYANRSAVYFELNEFETCLDNIRLAKASGYPERLMEKLIAREVRCQKAVQSPCTADDEKKMITHELRCSRRTLSLTPNSRIPFIGERLELKQSKRYGKYIVTNQDLKPGQIICMEDPYATAVAREFIYQRCANCLKENGLNLLPCRLCTTAMFCSETCLNESINGVHEFICPISDYIWKHFDGNELMINLVVKTFLSFDSVSELREFYRNNDKSTVTTFSFDHSKPLSAQQKYHPIHTMLTNEEKRLFHEMFIRSAMVGHLHLQFIAHTKFGEMLTTQDDRKQLIECIARLMQISALNSHRLVQLDHQANKEGFASGLYPFCSQINHSCVPNIARITFGNKLVIFVLRPIKQGHQLFDCYYS